MKKALQVFLGLFGVTAILIASLHVALGPSAIPGSIPVNATMDSEDRFYATLFGAYGVALLWCIRDVERKSMWVYFLAGTFFVGGLARVVSMLAVGPPNAFFVTMTSLELLIPVVIAVVQRRISALAITGEDAAAGRTPERPSGVGTMIENWPELTRALAPWVPSDDLDAFADHCEAIGLEARVLLLGLAERHGGGSRLGRACRVLTAFRGADGTRYRVSRSVIVGAVRFMFEGERDDNTEDDLEDLLKDMLLPCPHPEEAEQRAETMLGFIADARDSEVVQGTARFGKMMKAIEKAGGPPSGE